MAHIFIGSSSPGGPIFSSFRIRAFNSSAKAVAHNLKSDSANLHTALGGYGWTEGNAALLGAPSAVFNSADSHTISNLSMPASATTPGARLAGTIFDSSNIRRDLAVPVALGKDMMASVITDITPAAAGQAASAFLIMARNYNGDTAYGLDSDLEKAFYSVSNPGWPGKAGLQALAPGAGVKSSSDDFAGQPGGGAPTGNWMLVE